MKVLKFLSAVLLAGLALASVGLAQANTYPSKPVHIIVPYPAGGSGDLLASAETPRLITKYDYIRTRIKARIRS